MKRNAVHCVERHELRFTPCKLDITYAPPWWHKASLAVATHLRKEFVDFDLREPEGDSTEDAVVYATVPMFAARYRTQAQQQAPCLIHLPVNNSMQGTLIRYWQIRNYTELPVDVPACL